MSKFKFFVSQDELSRNSQIFLENWYALWQEKLNNWHSIGTLSRKNEKLTQVLHVGTWTTLTRIARINYHALFQIVNATMKTKNNFYDMYTSWWKKSLNRCGVLDYILCEWRLVMHHFEWLWVILGRWVQMGVFRALLWVDGSGWGIILCG